MKKRKWVCDDVSAQKNIVWFRLKGQKNIVWFLVEASESVGIFLKLFEVDFFRQRKAFLRKNGFL